MSQQSTWYPRRNTSQVCDCTERKTWGTVIDKAKEVLCVVLRGRNPALGWNSLSRVLLESHPGKDKVCKIITFVYQKYTYFWGVKSGWCSHCCWLWKYPSFALSEEDILCLCLPCVSDLRAAHVSGAMAVAGDVCSTADGKGKEALQKTLKVKTGTICLY